MFRMRRGPRREWNFRRVEMKKESCRAFKAGQHEKEWRVRASSNGNKGAVAEEEAKGSQVQLP